MRDDRERLQDILEAIGQIEKYVGQGREAFDGDELKHKVEAIVQELGGES